MVYPPPSLHLFPLFLQLPDNLEVTPGEVQGCSELNFSSAAPFKSPKKIRPFALRQGDDLRTGLHREAAVRKFWDFPGQLAQEVMGHGQGDNTTPWPRQPGQGSVTTCTRLSPRRCRVISTSPRGETGWTAVRGPVWL